MEIVLKITAIISTIMSVMLFHRVILDIIGFFASKKYPEAKVKHNYGFLIAARNEKNVIGQLIKSIQACDYDSDKVRIFVIADNCTDNTAEIAREAGATVFERFNKEQIGKGYALDFLMARIHETEPDYLPDGWIVMDADNLLDKQYIKEMNNAFDAGVEVVTSLRNGKNYDTNWVSAVGCMAFMRECLFYHSPRARIGLSSKITGTGWLVKNTILNFETGFPWHMILEDSQFTLENVLKGVNIGYQNKAIFYDEQPTKMKTVYKQRMRWQTGTYANIKRFFWKYLKKLFSKTDRKEHKFKRKLEIYDHFLDTVPFDLVSVLLLIVNICCQITIGIIKIASGATLAAGLLYIAQALLVIFAGTYFGLFVYGVLLQIRDWDKMAASKKAKIVSMFMYPLFIISIMPISILALFKKSAWVPIPHEDTRTISELDNILDKKRK